jgi:hypothetical protein
MMDALGQHGRGASTRDNRQCKREWKISVHENKSFLLDRFVIAHFPCAARGTHCATHNKVIHDELGERRRSGIRAQN